MAIGKQSLNRVAKTNVIASPSPEVAAAVITEEAPKAAAAKAPATKKAPKVTAQKTYAVGDKLPEYLL